MAEDHDPCAEDLAAYVLDALEAPDRARVEAHLPDCGACMQQVREYQDVAGLLAYGLSADAPPRDVRAELFARVRGQRVSRRRRVGRAWARLIQRLRPLRWALVALLVVGLLLWNIRLQLAGRDGVAEIERLAHLPHGRTAVLIGAGAGRAADGRLYVDEDDARGSLAVAGLPVPATGHVYQLWFIRPDGSRVSAASFQVDARGAAALVFTVPGPLDQYVGIAVTEEPDGGSVAPSGPDVLFASL